MSGCGLLSDLWVDDRSLLCSSFVLLRPWSLSLSLSLSSLFSLPFRCTQSCPYLHGDDGNGGGRAARTVEMGDLSIRDSTQQCHQ